MCVLPFTAVCTAVLDVTAVSDPVPRMGHRSAGSKCLCQSAQPSVGPGAPETSCRSPAVGASASSAGPSAVGSLRGRSRPANRGRPRGTPRHTAPCTPAEGLPGIVGLQGEVVAHMCAEALLGFQQDDAHFFAKFCPNPFKPRLFFFPEIILKKLFNKDQGTIHKGLKAPI